MQLDKLKNVAKKNSLFAKILNVRRFVYIGSLYETNILVLYN